MSDLVRILASTVDEMRFVHSMVGPSQRHGPAYVMQNRAS